MTNKQLRQIYDKFEKKDMAFSDFCKEMRDLGNPVKMQEDLGQIELIKAREQANRAMVDRAVKRGNN